VTAALGRGETRRPLPRPPRTWPPPLRQEAIVLAAPPDAEEPDRGGLLAALLPALSGLGILAWAVTGGPRVLLWLGVAMVVLMLGAGLLMRRTSRRANARRAEQRRERYREHLTDIARTLLEAGRRQRESAEDAHPEAWSLAGRAATGQRLWERRPRDPDAVRVRLGRGRVPLAVEVRYDAADGLQESDQELDAAARSVVADTTSIEDHPVLVDLAGSSLVIVGADGADGAAALVRSVVLELACARPPGELAIVGLSPPAADASWLEALPHTRGTAADTAAARLLLRPLLSASAAPVPLLLAHCCDPEALPVLDQADLSDGNGGGSPPRPEDVSRLAEEVAAAGGLVIVFVRHREHAPPDMHLVVTVDNSGTAWLRRSEPGVVDRCVARPDSVTMAFAAQVAESLGRWSCAAEGAAPASTTMPALLRAARKQEGALSRLRIPLGLDDDGHPVVLDLDEPAHGGDGPHGLVVGATGSGKSELLRTLVGGLLATRDPEQLAVVLVDYKGGATFRGMEQLPQVAGYVTNLDSEDTTARFADALGGELDRRQRLLRDAGHPDLDAWRTSAHFAGAPPPLLVVIDEFAELLEAAPDLLAVMVRTCRVGRSLGVHLLLATQRLDEGRLAGLDGHLRYRLCLRTGSSGESRVVLGVDDAATLPARPGAALLAVDGRLRRLQVARCSDTDLAEALQGDAYRKADEPAQRARAVWRPPLPHRVALPAPAAALPAADALRPALGLVDRPRQQDQAPLRLDLAGAGGHLAIAGAPFSGTTTALQAVVCALALANDSQQLQVLVVSTAGSGLATLQDLPQVGSVAGAVQTALIRRTVLDTRDIVRARAEAFAAANLASVLQWRAAGRPSADGRGELFLVVDGWAGLQQDDELAAASAEIATNGLGVGVHLLVSVRSWAELRGPVRSAFGSRLELRLQDPYESEVDRKAAARLPADAPGRVVLPGGLIGQLALPTLQVDAEAGSGRLHVSGLDPDLLAHAGRGSASKAAPVRLLPARLPLPPQRQRGPGLLLGVAESGLAQQYLTPRDGRHLLVLGDAGSGRTSLLGATVRQHVEVGSRVHLVDPRGTSAALRHEVTSYTTSIAGAETLAAALGDGSPALDRPASSWGAGSVVVVDDYDLLAQGLTSPLAALADLLDAPAPATQGVTLVLARRVGGFSRACFDPLLQRLLELSACSLLLDGDPAEGPVLGSVRPRSLPPGRALLIRRGRAPVLVQAVVDGVAGTGVHDLRSDRGTEGSPAPGEVQAGLYQ